MLQRIRDNASGPLAYVVVAIITLVFGVWGIGSYFTPSSNPVVASVGSTDITRYQLRQASDQRYQRVRELMGDRFDPELVPRDELRRNVLQGMITNAVLSQHAGEAGYRVSDAGLLAAIRNDDRFHAGGEFSSQRYRRLLSQAGIAPAQYEARLRDDLSSQQLRNEIVDSAFVVPAQVEQAYKLANQERKLRVLRFDPAAYQDQVEVSSAEVQSYYDEHPDRFQSPARVKLAYVALQRGSSDASATLDEQALRAVYQDNKARFENPEKRSGAQIRVPISNDGSSVARDAIQKLSSAVTDDSTAFEGAVKDAGGNAEYSRIDAATQEQLPADVGEALFGLEQGQISSPVRGDDAWYLLRVDDVMAATTQDFDSPEVQSQLKRMAREQSSADAYQDKLERMEALAYEAPNGLDTLAEELDLDIQHSDWINRDAGEGIGQYDAIRKAAFSDAVMKDKLNSTPIQLGSDRRIVLRVDESQPAKRQSLDAVESRIRERLTARKASDKARQAAQKALEALRAGQSMEQLVGTGEQPRLETPGYIKRSGQPSGGAVDARIREAAFALPAPGEGRAGYKVTPTSDGAIAVVAVESVRDGGGDTDAQRQQLAGQQRDYTASLEYAALTAYLRDNADIEINEQQLN